MKTILAACLKVLLVVALGVVVIHVWPATIVPFIVGLLLVLGLGVLLLTGLVTAGVIGTCVAIGLLVAAGVLLAVLSPVWIPLAAVVGIVWLVRELGRSRQQPAATA
jgi:hypothetical protein